jgi:hypothetical protein
VDELAKTIGYGVMLIGAVWCIEKVCSKSPVISDLLEIGFMLCVVGMMFIAPAAVGLNEMYKGNYGLGVIMLAFPSALGFFAYRSRNK